MKITQLFKIYWPDNGGGIAKVMEGIASGLTEYEHEIIVCQGSRHKKSMDDTYQGIAVRRCRQIFAPVSTPVSLRFLYDVKTHTKDTDIVISHFPYPMADLAVLFGLYSGHLVVWWHCGFEKYERLAPFYRPLVQHTLNKADRILVSSRENIKNSALLRRYRNKCSVIPFCVDHEYLERGNAYARACEEQEKKTAGKITPGKLPAGNRQVRILFIGRLVWYKGCDVLLQAFAKMRLTDCRLVLVGSGPLEQQLKDLASDLKLKNVTFTGMISEEEKMQQIEACDFLVLPSVSKAEAFAVVQLEAMAFGKPVINTALPSGVPYVSIDGVTGKTVKPGSIRELTAAMEELAQNEPLRRKYGANARRIVQEEYTQELMVDRHRRVFKKLCEGKTEKVCRNVRKRAESSKSGVRKR